MRQPWPSDPNRSMQSLHFRRRSERDNSRQSRALGPPGRQAKRRRDRNTACLSKNEKEVGVVQLAGLESLIATLSLGAVRPHAWLTPVTILGVVKCRKRCSTN